MKSELNLRHLLLSGAGVLCALPVLMGGSVPTLAQKGNIFTPASMWAVTKMSGQGSRYCTLSRKYQYDTILTLAKNLKSETTLALDFQRPILKKADLLEVSLDPGAGVVRHMKLKPISSQAIAAKLGVDEIFMNALADTGFLTVRIGTQTYNFDVSNFEEGSNMLTGCISALPEPIEIAPVIAKPVPVEAPSVLPPIAADMAIPPMPQMAEQVSTPRDSSDKIGLVPPAAIVEDRAYEDSYTDGAFIEAQIATMQQQVRDLIARNTVLSRDLRDKSMELEAVKDQASQTALSLESARAQILQKDNALSQAQAMAEERQFETQKINALSAQLAQLRNEKSELSRQLTETQNKLASFDPVADAQAIAALKSENARLSEALQMAHKDQAKAAQTAKAVLEGRERELLGADQKKKAELSAMQQEIETLRSQNEINGQELVESSRQRQKLEELRGRLVTLEEENRLLKTAVTEGAGQSTIVVQLEDKVKALEFEKEALEERLSALSADDSRAVAEMEALRRQNESLELALRQAQTNIGDLQSQLTAVEGSGSEVAQGYTMRLQEKQGALEALSGQVRIKDEQIGTLTRRVSEKDAHIEGLDAQLNERGVVIDSLSKENAVLKGRLVETGAVIEALERQQNSSSYADDMAMKEPVPEVRAAERSVEMAEPASGEEGVITPLQNAPALSEQAHVDNAAQGYERDMKRAMGKERAIPEEFVQEEITRVELEHMEQDAPANIVRNEAALPAAEELQPPEMPEEIALAVDDEAQIVDLEEPLLPPYEGAVHKEIAHHAAVHTPHVHDYQMNTRGFTPAVTVQEIVAAVYPNTSAHLLEKFSNNEQLVYQWEREGVYGSAEQKLMQGPQGFEDLVMGYLERAKERCNGEFAILPSDTQDFPTGLRADSYDMACVDGNVNSSAALVFIAADDTFSVFAHEAPTENLMEAMEGRERIIEAVMSGGST